MHQFNDSFDALIKKPERVRVSEHHTDDSIITGGFQGLQIHVAARVGWDGYNGHAHHAYRGRVCPVRSIWDEHLCAFLIAARIVIGAHHQHTCKFSVRARGGL